MSTLSINRGLCRFAHGLKHAFAELGANALAASEIYVRIVYDRPWAPPAPKGSVAGRCG